MASAQAGKIQLLMLKNKVASAFFCDEAIHYNSKQNTPCGKVKAVVKCLYYYAIIFVITKVIHIH